MIETVLIQKIGGKNYILADDAIKAFSVKNDALVWGKQFFLERDRMNAAVHCAPLRLSPITERFLLALGEEFPKL
jgi:hypothetical protein